MSLSQNKITDVKIYEHLAFWKGDMSPYLSCRCPSFRSCDNNENKKVCSEDGVIWLLEVRTEGENGDQHSDLSSQHCAALHLQQKQEQEQEQGQPEIEESISFPDWGRSSVTLLDLDVPELILFMRGDLGADVWRNRQTTYSPLGSPRSSWWGATEEKMSGWTDVI